MNIIFKLDRVAHQYFPVPRHSRVGGNLGLDPRFRGGDEKRERH